MPGAAGAAGTAGTPSTPGAAGPAGPPIPQNEKYVVYNGNRNAEDILKFTNVYDKKGSINLAEGEIANIPVGTVAIFYAPWCGYCKASMDEFKKARDYSNGKVILVDGTKNRKLMEKYNISGYPTIIKDNDVYNGSRKSEAILDYANGK